MLCGLSCHTPTPTLSRSETKWYASILWGLIPIRARSFFNLSETFYSLGRKSSLTPRNREWILLERSDRIVPDLILHVDRSERRLHIPLVRCHLHALPSSDSARSCKSDPPSHPVQPTAQPIAAPHASSQKVTRLPEWATYQHTQTRWLGCVTFCWLARCSGSQRTTYEALRLIQACFHRAGGLLLNLHPRP